MVKNTEIINNPGPSEYFHEQLEGILSRQLTPENIDSYADDALHDLLNLAGQAVDAYAGEYNVSDLSGEESEDEAFDYYNLGSIGELLDHIADISDSLHQIDYVIQNAPTSNVINVPTEETERTIHSGNREFRPKKIEKRVKTVLFLLETSFGIDLEDKSQISIDRGDEPTDMVRLESYFVINVPELARTLLVCDEEGNVTYAFDRQIAIENGIDDQVLKSMSKPKLDMLINSVPGVGRRIRYSKHFLRNVKNSIENTLTPDTPDEPDGTPSEDIQYLRKLDTAPGGWLTVNAIHNLFGAKANEIYRAIAVLGASIVEAPVLTKAGNKMTKVYSPAAQDQIMAQVRLERQSLDTEFKGYISAYGIHTETGIGFDTIKRVIGSISDKLGPVKFLDSLATGGPACDKFSPDQHKTILQELTDRGYLSEQRPNGHLCIAEIASNLKLNWNTVDKAVTALNFDPKTVKKALIGSKITEIYSKDQQGDIYALLDKAELFAKAPTDKHASIPDMVIRFGKDYRTIKKVINILGDSLDPPAKTKIGSNITVVYSEADQIKIGNYIKTWLRKSPDKNGETPKE